MARPPKDAGISGNSGKDGQAARKENRPPEVAGQEGKPDRGFFDDIQALGEKSRFSAVTVSLLVLAFLAGGVIFLFKPAAESFLKPRISGETYLPVTKTPKSLSLDINYPDEESLVYDKTLTVSGKISSKASVVIANNDRYTATETDEDGNFSKVIDLNPGANNITVFAFDSRGNNKTDTRTVYYTTERLPQ